MHSTMDRLFHANRNTEWHASELVTINNRQWFQMDFTIQALDTRIRNIMYGTSSGGRAALVSFNVTQEREEQWIEAAKVMLASMRAID